MRRVTFSLITILIAAAALSGGCHDRDVLVFRADSTGPGLQFAIKGIPAAQGLSFTLGLRISPCDGQEGGEGVSFEPYEIDVEVVNGKAKVMIEVPAGAWVLVEAEAIVEGVKYEGSLVVPYMEQGEAQSLTLELNEVQRYGYLQLTISGEGLETASYMLHLTFSPYESGEFDPFEKHVAVIDGVPTDRVRVLADERLNIDASACTSSETGCATYHGLVEDVLVHEGETLPLTIELTRQK